MGLLSIPESAVTRARSDEHWFPVLSFEARHVEKDAVANLRLLGFRLEPWGKDHLQTRANGVVQTPPGFDDRPQRRNAVSLHHESGHAKQRRKMGNARFHLTYGLGLGGWWWLEAQCWRMSLDADVVIRLSLGESLDGVVDLYVGKLTSRKLYPIVKAYRAASVRDASEKVLAWQFDRSVKYHRRRL